MSHERKYRHRWTAALFAALLLWAFAASLAWSADPPTPEAAAERTRLEVQYALKTDIVSDAELDPVVFTEIVPFTAEESAVRLPPDQDLD